MRRPIAQNCLGTIAFFLAVLLWPLGTQAQTAKQKQPPSASRMTASKKLEVKVNAAADAFERGLWDDAARLFNEVVAVAPRHALAWHFLGQSLDRTQGSKEDVLVAFERSLELQPTGRLAERNKMKIVAFPREWIKDDLGCKVWNPNPKSYESIKWSGNCIAGYAEGTGKVYWFKDGISNGYLDGSLRKGKAEGACLSVFGNGERKEGECIDGKMQGRGTHTFPNGDRFEGNFVDGLYDGFGVMTGRDGTSCESQFKKGKTEGRSKCTKANGTRIEGIFLNGNLDGEVSINFARGDWFKGRFRDGLPNGFGSYYNSVSGNTYTGEFRNGCYKDPYDSTRVAAVWVESSKCGF